MNEIATSIGGLVGILFLIYLRLGAILDELKKQNAPKTREWKP